MYTLDNYLIDQIKHHETKLNPDAEINLNNLGVFDSEINQLSDDILTSINNGADYYVDINYYTEAPSENKHSKSTPSLEELSKSNIDQLINDTVSRTTQTDEETTESGKVKRTLITTYTKGNLNASLVYTWIEVPKYTLTDIMDLYIKNGSPDYHTISRNYSCYMATFSNGAITTCTDTPSLKYNDHGVAAKQKLYSTNNAVGYFNHTLSLNYRANIDDMVSWRYVVLTGQYLHQQTSLSVNPSFSLTGIASVSLAVSIQSKFTELTNPPQIFVYFK